MTGSRWSDAFEPRGRSIPGSPPAPPRAEPDEEALAIDLNTYQPWVLQRGRTRPVMLLHLRRFEPRSGLWMGWALSYPSLIAAEYVGDRMISLDFGMRQFMVEGAGLNEVIGPLQQGSLLALQEYNTAVWPGEAHGPSISSIRRVGVEGPPQR